MCARVLLPGADVDERGRARPTGPDRATAGDDRCRRRRQRSGDAATRPHRRPSAAGPPADGAGCADAVARTGGRQQSAARGVRSGSPAWPRPAPAGSGSGPGVAGAAAIGGSASAPPSDPTGPPEPEPTLGRAGGSSADPPCAVRADGRPGAGRRRDSRCRSPTCVDCGRRCWRRSRGGGGSPGSCSARTPRSPTARQEPGAGDVQRRARGTASPRAAARTSCARRCRVLGADFRIEAIVDPSVTGSAAGPAAVRPRGGHPAPRPGRVSCPTAPPEPVADAYGPAAEPAARAAAPPTRRRRRSGPAASCARQRRGRASTLRPAAAELRRRPGPAGPGAAAASGRPGRAQAPRPSARTTADAAARRDDIDLDETAESHTELLARHLGAEIIAEEEARRIG